jgi:hypothetical protein
MRLAANRERVTDLQSVREAVAALTEPKPEPPRTLQARAPGRRSAAVDQAWEAIDKALQTSDDPEWAYPPAWALEILVAHFAPSP